MHLRNTDDGAAAVEFALVLPILLLVFCGIIDFGRAWNMQIALSQGAREGVRVLALNGTTSDAEGRAREAAFPVDNITVVPVECPNASDDAQITASRTYDYITPVQGILRMLGLDELAAPVITGRGRMRCNG